MITPDQYRNQANGMRSAAALGKGIIELLPDGSIVDVDRIMDSIWQMIEEGAQLLEKKAASIEARA